MSLSTPKSLILLSFFLGLPAVAASVDVENGCGVGKSREVAVRHCEYFTITHTANSSPKVLEAQKQCRNFYEIAHSIQNTFCSYKKEAGAFSERAEAATALAGVEKSHASNATVAQLNAEFGEINNAYVKVLLALGPQMEKEYTTYLQKLGKMNAEGTRSELSETVCVVENVNPVMPGWLESAMAQMGHGDAQKTRNSLMPALRENVLKLKSAGANAAANATNGVGRSINMGEITASEGQEKTAPAGDALSSGPVNTDGKKNITPAEGLAQGVAQGKIANYAGAKIAKKATDIAVARGGEAALKTWGPAIAKWAPVAGNVAGGVSIVLYNYWQNKRIAWPELVATFITMAHTGWGVAAQGTVALARENQANMALVKEYQNFIQPHIKEDMDATSFELMEKWHKARGQQWCLDRMTNEKAFRQKKQSEKPFAF